MPKKNLNNGSDGITRRSFLTSMGAGAVGAAVSENLAAAGKEPYGPQVIPAGQTSKLSLRINGKTHVVLAEARWTLIYCLRDVIGLTGAKPGIGHLKQEHRIDRNRLSGVEGDRFNGILSAVGMNFHKLLRWVAAFLRQIFCWLLLSQRTMAMVACT